MVKSDIKQTIVCTLGRDCIKEGFYFLPWCEAFNFQSKSAKLEIEMKIIEGIQEITVTKSEINFIRTKISTLFSLPLYFVVLLA